MAFDRRYSAQHMLTTFQPSQHYGQVPADPVTAIAGAIGESAKLTGTIISAIDAPKQRAHEEKLAKKQTKAARAAARAQKIAAQEARLAAEAQAAAGKAYALYIGGSIVLLGMSALGVFAWTKRGKQR